jgi:nucleotide-binding universal stress UspA family protein
MSLRDRQGRRVADAIVAQAQESGCDLIVIGTHGRRGLSRALLGSDAERVLRHSTVPVLLVREKQAA